MVIKKKKGDRKGRPVSRHDVNALSNDEFAAQLQAVCGEPTYMSVKNDIDVPLTERADSPLAAPLEDTFMCEEEMDLLTKEESPKTEPSSGFSTLLYFTIGAMGRPIAARNVAGPSMIITHMPKSAHCHPSQTFPLLRHATPAEFADPLLFPPMVSIADGLMFIDDLPSRRFYYQRVDAHGTLWADWNTLVAEARVGCDVLWFEWVMAFTTPQEQPGTLCNSMHAQRVVNASAYELEDMDKAKWVSELESQDIEDQDDEEEDDDDDEDDAEQEEGREDSGDERWDSGSDTLSDGSSEWSDVEDSMDEDVFEAMLRDARAALARLHLAGGAGVVDDNTLADMLNDARAATANRPPPSPQPVPARLPPAPIEDEIVSFLADMVVGVGSRRGKWGQG